MNTMKSGLTRQEQREMINAYLIASIDGEGYEQTFATDQERINFIITCFQSEYVKNNPEAKRMSKQALFANWLMGLPSCFNIDFENYRIIELAKLWGSLPQDAPERLEDKIIGNWFNYIAFKTFQLHKALNKA